MNKNNPGMSLIVKTITRLTVGLIFLYGVYIVLHGHLSPGGGFAGGVIIALSFIHLMLAFGKQAALKRLSEGAVHFFEDFGALFFLSLALLGFTGGYFFRNFFAEKGVPFALFSGGSIPLANIAIAFKVGAGLLAVFVALVALKIDSKGKDK